MSCVPVGDTRRDVARVSPRRALVVAFAFALASCAAPSPRGAGDNGLAVGESFEVSGRFSARRGEEGVAGQFSWSHASASDVLTFSAPTGQALARLSGDAQRVRLEAPDGRASDADDWEQLTATALGVPIPVRSLAYWVRGVPRPGASHQQERNAEGRMSLLRQDGWEIVYGYAESSANPARVRLTYPDVDVRLALDSWR